MGVVVLERPSSGTTCMQLKSRNLNLITSFWTGISTILLDFGKTVHSTFKLPIPFLPDPCCRITPDSERARVLREAVFFVSKKISTVSKDSLQAIDRFCRNIFQNDVPFD